MAYHVDVLQVPCSDLEDPSDFMGCRVVSFSRKHRSFRHPDTLDLDGIGMRRKLACGTAFALSYYEHGSCAWSLKGEGFSCSFDSVRFAGILYLDEVTKGEGVEARRKRARAFLEVYTAWCNGAEYEAVITDEDGEHFDSCGGFYLEEDAWAWADVEVARLNA